MLDCLVVGAGPTGLVMAAELRRHGMEVRIIDKLATPSPLSRAIGVQARTLEILDEMDAAEPLIAAGLPLHGATLYSGREPIAAIGFDELDSRYPFLLSVRQHDTERVLIELLERRRLSVERAVELIGFEQSDGDSDGGVTAELRHPDGRIERVAARFLLGCDGAHSVVRQGLELQFQGEAFPEGFVLADVQLEWELPRDRVATFFSADGVMACFPLFGGRWRLIANTGASPADAHAPSLAEVQKIVDTRAGFPARLQDPHWLARFRIHSRQVSQYRVGRVFLAGDAAHIHSPVGGQGMNTGMQDAHNLGWKLAQVTHGQAPPSLLDSYHAERHRIGRDILRGTELATRAATLRRPVVRALRDQVARYLSSLEVVQRRIARTVAELSLSYQKSPIVGEHQDTIALARLGRDDGDDVDEAPTIAAHRRFAAGPRAGERAPDAQLSDRGHLRQLFSLLGDGRHTVLLFDGRARADDGYRTLAHIVAALEARFSSSLRSFVVASGAEPITWQGPLGRILLDRDGEAEDAFGATAECVYVIRPDRYIGYRSQPASLERLLGHLELVALPSV